MACVGVIRLGDEKTSIEILVRDCVPPDVSKILDITSATDLTIRFKRENGSEIEKPGVIYTGGLKGNGADGIVQYITEAGFITKSDIGTLHAIAIITFADGSKYHSSPTEYEVKANF